MTTETNDHSDRPAATLVADHSPATDTLTLRLAGSLDTAHISPLWQAAAAALDKLPSPPARIIVDAAQVTYCDVSGVAFFTDLRRRHREPQTAVEIRNLAEPFQPLLALFNPDDFPVRPPAAAQPLPFIENLGAAGRATATDLRHLIEFSGALLFAFAAALKSPKKIRWRDTLLVAERAGADALPIVSLLGFLMGLIIAFQSAIPMAKFGAEIYVADFVGIAMLRELGPLMTCIILAGRSGSAFAAEIGTMKVNEEINALKTMSLDPVHFLVVPRTIAALLMTPLLTVFANLMGLAGAAIVILSMGYSFTTYVNEVLNMVHLPDFLGGLFKSIVFGLIVASVGCLRGLQTRTGPDAVGVSATRAVVTGITLIVVTDGIFSVLFYYLKI